MGKEDTFGGGRLGKKTAPRKKEWLLNDIPELDEDELEEALEWLDNATLAKLKRSKQKG